MTNSWLKEPIAPKGIDGDNGGAHVVLCVGYVCCCGCQH